VGRTANTINAYGRCANDYLAFCQRAGVAVLDATKRDIVAYLEELLQRPNPRRAITPSHPVRVGLANATVQQRLTVIRLLYDYFIDEHLRPNPHNPVARGRYTPGTAFAGKRERALLPHYERLPWIPGDDEWNAILDAARAEPIRNQLMLLLAYDGALRRSELVALETRDLRFAEQQLAIRPEITKNGRGRVVMYGPVAQRLLHHYLQERTAGDIAGGHLFRSRSNRNRAQGVTADAWDKTVTRIAQRADLLHRFTTHTPRHLRLTDLARTGMDLHAIAQYAGHRSLETTKLYIRLSGRETAEQVRLRLRDLDTRLNRLLDQEQL